MINYSIVMRRKNLADKESEKLAYATAQYNSVMTLDKFAAHIASHGSVYSRADIAAVLTLAVDCLHEQLLAGQKIELGDLGAFCISLNCTGAESAETFDPSVNVKRVKARWEMGDKFLNLTEEAEFNLVANRATQAAVLRAIKAGDTTVTLVTGTGGTASDSGSDEGNTDTGNTDTGNSDAGNTNTGGDDSNPL